MKNPPREKNPARSTEDAIVLFKETIRQPGVESLRVAQDILEEAGITLAQASLDQGDLSETSGTRHHLRHVSGIFHLIGNAAGEIEDEFVSWTVTPVGYGQFSIEWVVAFAEETWVESDRREYRFRDEAIHVAVRDAWRMVKLIKHLPPSSHMQTFALAWEGKGLAAFESVEWPNNDPSTVPWLVSKYGTGHPQFPYARSNPAPAVSPKALRMYRGFHQLEPKRIGDFHPDLVIPDVCYCVGEALHVLYRSDKLNPTTGQDEGMIDYIHKHDRGVRVYRCDRGGASEGEPIRTPAWIRSCDELVKLGDCNGLAYRSITTGKKVTADGTEPYPELYATPSGKCLLVIQGKRRLLALIWGGRLGVEPRGIVH